MSLGRRLLSAELRLLASEFVNYLAKKSVTHWQVTHFIRTRTPERPLKFRIHEKRFSSREIYEIPICFSAKTCVAAAHYTSGLH